MKKLTFSALTPLFLLFSLLAFSQPDDLKGFKMKGINPTKIGIGKAIDATTELYPFGNVTGSIFGMSVSGKVTFTNEDGELRIILVDKNHREYLAYEMYSLLADKNEVAFDGLCDETTLLDGIVPGYIRIELKNGVVNLDAVSVAGELPPGLNIAMTKKEIHQAQNNAKIEKLNQNLRGRGQLWVAGNTEVSSLSWAEKKQLYGQSKFPPGFEYYVGGILQTGPQLKAASASLMVDKWDWRLRHGKNWISPVKNQGGCGSCWAFAATGATEAQTNLFFNQVLNLNLSEQDILSCTGIGNDCGGGYPGSALTYIATTGIVNEEAFPYTATDQPCSNKSSNPTQLIKIAGKVDFPSASWPMEEDALKKMIIKYGPLSGGIYDWSHAIVLVGWQVVKAGDYFYTRNLNLSTGWITVPVGSPLIGTTVWIFKNSWGGSWGDAGYVYVQTAMSNVGWTHALLNPVQSLKQTYTVSYADGDGDGYYWWGLGPKPAACPGPSTPDGDDSNATLGPLDAYGYCTVLGGAPVANFSADKTALNTGGTVSFSDLSTGAPTSWSWTFAGGNPATSTQQNPVVSYAAPGNYDVSLTVINANGSSTKTMTNYITVNAIIPTYCTSNGNATREWISKVVLNGITSNSGASGTTGYQDFTTDDSRRFSVLQGNNYTMSLTPSFSSKTTNAEAFSVWIDFNHDFDFGDAGEQVLTATKIKAAFSKTIAIPAGIPSCTTRMRVSMKRNALSLPCEIFANGEVEDYTIVIGTPGVKNALIGKTGEQGTRSIKIYPNPALEKLTIALDEVFEGDNCSLYNMQGMLISKMTLGESINRLNVSGLTPGIYLIEVNNGTNRFMEKFVKP
jgi:PKD repeat protein